MDDEEDHKDDDKCFYAKSFTVVVFKNFKFSFRVFEKIPLVSELFDQIVHILEDLVYTVANKQSELYAMIKIYCGNLDQVVLEFDSLNILRNQSKISKNIFKYFYHF